MASIRTYHAVLGRLGANDIAGKKLDPKTVRGQTLATDTSEGTLKVNDATVTKTDIVVVDNGVIPSSTR